MANQTAKAQPADSGLFRRCIAIPIRYDDIDARRHLNNAAHFVLVQQARLECPRAVVLWSGHDLETVRIILRKSGVQVCCDWAEGRSIPMAAASRAAIQAYELALERAGQQRVSL